MTVRNSYNADVRGLGHVEPRDILYKISENVDSIEKNNIFPNVTKVSDEMKIIMSEFDKLETDIENTFDLEWKDYNFTEYPKKYKNVYKQFILFIKCLILLLASIGVLIVGHDMVSLNGTLKDTFIKPFISNDLSKITNDKLIAKTNCVSPNTIENPVTECKNGEFVYNNTHYCEAFFSYDYVIFYVNDDKVYNYLLGKSECINNITVTTTCSSESVEHHYEYWWGTSVKYTLNDWPISVYNESDNKCIEPNENVIKGYATRMIQSSDVMSRSYNFNLSKQRYVYEHERTRFYIDYENHQTVPEYNLLTLLLTHMFRYCCCLLNLSNNVHR